MKINLKLSLSEEVWSRFIEEIKEFVPFKIKDTGVEPHRYLYIKVNIEKVDCKIKIAPVVYEGKFAIEIISIILSKVGLKIDGILGKLTNSVLNYIIKKYKSPVKVKIKGRFIVFEDFESDFAGFQNRDIFINLKYRINE